MPCNDRYETRTKNEQIVDNVDFVNVPSCESLSAEQVESYNENGFLVIENFFDLKDINKALLSSEEIFHSKACKTSVLESESDSVRSHLAPHLNDEFNILLTKKLVDLSKSVLGGYTYIHQSRINFKSGMDSKGWSWHSDFETWHAQDGMPKPKCFTAMIPLVENTPENGAVMMLSRSHRHYIQCRKPDCHSTAEENFADQKEGVPVASSIIEVANTTGGSVVTACAKKGDLVIFDGNTLHTSNPNNTPDKRTNLFFVFSHIDNKLGEPYTGEASRPEHMGSRTNLMEFF